MDTYIRMCGEAEQIQKGWKNKKSHIGDKIIIHEFDEIILITKEIEFWNEKYEGGEDREYITFEKKALKPPIPFTEWHKGTFYKYDDGGLNVIYLPTEEQLQEIAMTLGSLQGRVMQPFWELVDQFNYFIFGDETRKYVSQFNSFKEFWFAFVMKEKYNKIWDGKTWIKGT